MVEINVRKHPVCMVRGCDRLACVELTVGAPIQADPSDDTASGTGNIGVVEAKFCLQHAREINGNPTSISMSSHQK